ncbi:MAG: DUF1266 domain-containing protein [Lachnoclostridium sp.]|nr:DUF1266 domain-containing protein [Lachnospira sp.]MCM1248592.1 DUF1266 domain-containing protein [Lachnoclostridium sp.]
MGLFGLFGGSKSDPADSLPQNDAEKWTVGIYALWSEYCGGSYKYFGGYEKNRSNASMARGVLNRDWAITNKQGVIETIDYLLAEKNNTGDAEKKAAFNYGCAANIAARGYLGGHLTKEELMSESSKIAKVIRAKYHSWEEFTAQYIEGVGMESGIADKKDEFTEIYKRISALPDGPYTVAWETPM